MNLYDPRMALPVPNEPGPGGIIPGPKAGQIYIPSQGWVQADSWTQEEIYDTELIVTPVTAGDEYVFFRNLTFPLGARKDERFTSMTMPSQLPSGWHAVVFHVGFRVLSMETAAAGVFTSPEDSQRILTQGVGSFIIGSQKTLKQAPLEMWPCPFGMNASIMRTGGAVTTWSAVNNGIPSIGATPPNDIVTNLYDELTFEARVVFRGAMLLDAQTFLQCVMRSWIAKPVR